MKGIRNLAHKSTRFKIVLGTLFAVFACMVVLAYNRVDSTLRAHYFASLWGLPHSWTEWSPQDTNAYLEDLFAVGQDRDAIFETLNSTLQDDEWSFSCAGWNPYDDTQYCQISFEPLLGYRFYDRSVRFDRNGKVIWSAQTIGLE